MMAAASTTTTASTTEVRRSKRLTRNAAANSRDAPMTNRTAGRGATMTMTTTTTTTTATAAAATSPNKKAKKRRRMVSHSGNKATGRSTATATTRSTTTVLKTTSKDHHATTNKDNEKCVTDEKETTITTNAGSSSSNNKIDYHHNRRVRIIKLFDLLQYAANDGEKTHALSMLEELNYLLESDIDSEQLLDDENDEMTTKPHGHLCAIGFHSIISVMESFEDEPYVHKYEHFLEVGMQALQNVSHVCNININHDEPAGGFWGRRMINGNVIHVVTSAMWNFPQNARLQRHACGVLQNLAYCCDTSSNNSSSSSRKSELLRLAAPPDARDGGDFPSLPEERSVAFLLLKALQLHSDDEELVWQATGTVLNFASVLEFQNEMLTSLDGFSSRCGVDVLLDILSDHCYNPGILSRVMAGLGRLAETNIYAHQGILAKRGVHKIVHVLEKHKGNTSEDNDLASFRENGSIALEILLCLGLFSDSKVQCTVAMQHLLNSMVRCKDGVHEIAMGYADGIRAVLRAMDCHLMHQPLQRLATDILANLKIYRGQSVDALLKGDGVAVLVKVMERHPNQEFIQKNAVSLLWNLSKERQFSSKMSATNSCGVRVVSRILLENKLPPIYVYRACYILKQLAERAGAGSQLCRDIISAQGHHMAICASEEDPDHTDLAVTACLLLCRLSEGRRREHHESLREAGAIAFIQDVTKRHDYDRDLQAQAIDALARLESEW